MKPKALEKIHAVIQAKMRLEHMKYLNIRQKEQKVIEAEMQLRNQARAARPLDAEQAPAQYIVNAEKFVQERLSRALEERRKAQSIKSQASAQRANLHQALRKELLSAGMLEAAINGRNKKLALNEERRMEFVQSLKSTARQNKR